MVLCKYFLFSVFKILPVKYQIELLQNVEVNKLSYSAFDILTMFIFNISNIIVCVYFHVYAEFYSNNLWLGTRQWAIVSSV